MVSEVQRTRQQIELECQALRHMMLPARVASHETIQKKYASLDKHIDELATLIGETEANLAACEIYCRVIG